MISDEERKVMIVDRDVIKKLTPTAQVKELMLECLADGKEHNRKEITKYVKMAGEEMGLPTFSKGNISGGIFQAAKAEVCEKVASATYRLKKASHNENFSQAILNDICEFEEKIIALLRSVDIVNVSEFEMQRVILAKGLISDLASWKEKFENRQ